ncbi:hypothetical protein JHY03_00510 [Streptomyces sp. CA-256286]|nr:hypothetical protein JHY03_00510 [Streptomyces sp. CA-256286]
MDQSPDPVGDLDEDAERDQFGDPSVQFLPHRSAAANVRKGYGCVARKGLRTRRATAIRSSSVPLSFYRAMPTLSRPRRVRGTGLRRQTAGKVMFGSTTVHPG